MKKMLLLVLLAITISFVPLGTNQAQAIPMVDYGVTYGIHKTVIGDQFFKFDISEFAYVDQVGITAYGLGFGGKADLSFYADNQSGNLGKLPNSDIAWLWGNSKTKYFDLGPITGDFLNLKVNATVDWDIWRIDRIALNGGQEIVAAPVPEPSTVLLLGLGLITMAGLGRKKIKA